MPKDTWGILYRRALETGSWTRAEALACEKEARGAWDDPDVEKQVTIQ